MEKFEKFMIPITIILLIVLGWVFISGSKTPNTDKNSDVKASTVSKAYDTKRGEMGAVMLEVTPLSPAEYEISLNTHSVELDFDFTKIIKLKDDLGNTYDAKSWSGEQGGHHLQGTVVFPEIDPRAKDVTITISNIEDEVLNFEWEL